MPNRRPSPIPCAVRAWLAPLLVLLLGACVHDGEPLQQQAYVWQRVWTPALNEAVRQAGGDFAALRVLVAEMRPDGQFQTIAPALEVLAQSGLPVTAVIRIDGQLAGATVARLNPLLQTLPQQLRAAGITLRGIEIDHDCASARLAEYATLLHAVRGALGADLRLSITALPAWLDSPLLETVLAGVDDSILQVHAVQQPQQGLFSRVQAGRWIAAFATRSGGTPFRVALPAYGSRVEWDADGHIVAVTSEAPATRSGSSARELSADPREVAQLLRDLQRAPPPGLAGIVWFRLPSAEDQRAWQAVTLRAVIAAVPLHVDLVARALPRGADGLYDLALENRGNLDTDLPVGVTARVDAADCRADAVGSYAMADADGSAARAEIHWNLQAPARLAAGRQRIIGWLRCAHPLPEDVLHVEQ